MVTDNDFQLNVCLATTCLIVRGLIIMTTAVALFVDSIVSSSQPPSLSSIIVVLIANVIGIDVSWATASLLYQRIFCDVVLKYLTIFNHINPA